MEHIRQSLQPLCQACQTLLKIGIFTLKFMWRTLIYHQVMARHRIL